MSNPMVLVGCAVNEMYEYCLEQFIASIKTFTYKNYDILLVENSKTNRFLDKLMEQGLNVIKCGWHENARERIVRSRTILRDYAINNDYDWLLMLDQDVIPPRDVIEKLLAHKKRVICGVYYGIFQNKLKPVAWYWDNFYGSNNTNMFQFEHEKMQLYRLVYGFFGLGCCLIHRSTLNKVEIRYVKDKDTFEDTWFALDLKAKKIKIYADTSVLCKHLLMGKFNWKDVLK